jgi:hypothetical protein
MCKHVAAVLYGVGARLDERPELLFKLRQVESVPSAKPARARDPASRLLAALHRAGSLDNAAARAATGLDAEAVRPLLRQLVADGHARVHGQRRGTRYVAVGKARKP